MSRRPEPAEYRARLRLGVDAFVTDYPDTPALAMT